MEKVVLEKIHKVYNPDTPGAVHALRGVDLRINEGEMVGIRGVSGSGKSTLLHILGCLDVPTEGSYYLNGSKVQVNNGREMARIRNEEIGFVLQQFGLLLERKAIDNVRIPLMFASGNRSRNMLGKAYRMMRRLNIAHLAEKPCEQLSGGEKQRVAICRALVNRPNLILADEPTGSLDTRTRQDIMQVLRGLTDEGKTVVIVTHDPQVAKACDRVLTIEDGRFIDSDYAEDGASEG
ncbi:MAG: ABC transporter ATP-binding protein [Christensenellales bacterium]|jgi:putative ABC transport system ATP-binding protein